MFKVEFPAVSGDTILPAAVLPPLTPPPVERAAAPGGYLVRALEEEYSVDLATLQRWILESRVKADDQIRGESGSWGRVGDDGTFALFLKAGALLRAPAPAAEAPPQPSAAVPPAFPLPERVVPAPAPLGDVVEVHGADEEPPLPALDDDTRVEGEIESVGDLDTQESTLVSILQERTEEIRKGPVPVRRDYVNPSTAPTLAEQKPPPPSPKLAAAAALSPQPLSMSDLAAEFDVPVNERDYAVPDDGRADNDDPPPPPRNTAMGVAAVVVAIVLFCTVGYMGYRVFGGGAEPAEAASEAPAGAKADASPNTAEVGVPAVPPPVEVAPPEAGNGLAAAPAPEVVAPTPPPEPPAPVPTPVAVAPTPKPATPKPAVTNPVSRPPAELTTSDASKKGWALVNKGQYDSAFDTFSKALQKNPGNPNLLYGRGYANEKLGDDASAATDYCEALSASGIAEDTRRELQGGLGRLRRTCQ